MPKKIDLSQKKIGFHVNSWFSISFFCAFRDHGWVEKGYKGVL
jgi:hypothetical protein